jgi:hypothetical protein
MGKHTEGVWPGLPSSPMIGLHVPVASRIVGACDPSGLENKENLPLHGEEATTLRVSSVDAPQAQALFSAFEKRRARNDDPSARKEFLGVIVTNPSSKFIQANHMA